MACRLLLGRLIVPQIFKKCLVRAHVQQTLPRIFSHVKQDRAGFRTSSCLFDLSVYEYEAISKQTLDNLCEYFEEILEDVDSADVNLSDGVLTVVLGGGRGTYVINKQSPNKQIWLSSPISGPKRYDFVNSTWLYKHENRDLSSLLTEELRTILDNESVDFSQSLEFLKK